MLPASSRFRSVRAKFMNDANDKLNCMGSPFQSLLELRLSSPKTASVGEDALVLIGTDYGLETKNFAQAVHRDHIPDDRKIKHPTVAFRSQSTAILSCAAIATWFVI